MHPYHHHREHQGGHRRVHELLKGEPAGAKEHSKSHAFSKVTSKTAAEHHDAKVAGHKGRKRFARGGKVKHGDEAADKKLITKMLNEHEKKEEKDGYARGGKVKGHHTNINIVIPHRPAPPPAGPPAGPAGVPLPMAGPGLPPGGPGIPPGMPPGMPMHARGGKVIDGESTKADIKGWGKRAKKNSYAKGGFVKPAVINRAGASTGVGRLEAVEHMKHKKHK